MRWVILQLLTFRGVAGRFNEPAQDTLMKFGKNKYPPKDGWLQMFGEPTTYKTAVLVFANNGALSVRASSLPPRPPSHVLQQDEIRQGKPVP